MRSVGIILFILGVGSLILLQFGGDIRWMLWVDRWGRTAGMAIRIGFAVIGGLIWAITALKDKRERAEAERSYAE